MYLTAVCMCRLLGDPMLRPFDGHFYEIHDALRLILAKVDDPSVDCQMRTSVQLGERQSQNHLLTLPAEINVLIAGSVVNVNYLGTVWVSINSLLYNITACT